MSANANRRASLCATAVTPPEIDDHSFFLSSFRPITFRRSIFFFSFSSFANVRCTNAVKIAVTVRSRRVRARIAHGSLWLSVTVYSPRSYFAPVVLKKSQSTLDKYARAFSDGERVATYLDVLRTPCCRNSDKYRPSLFSLGE